jgi:hypothetical protein
MQVPALLRVRDGWLLAGADNLDGAPEDGEPDAEVDQALLREVMRGGVTRPRAGKRAAARAHAPNPRKSP